MARSTPPAPLPKKQEAHIHKLIGEWHKTEAELAILKEREKEQRLELAKAMKGILGDFKEGSQNKVAVGFGKILQLEHRISRKVDEPALQNLMSEAAKDEELAVLIDEIIRYKPEVNLTPWKAAGDETHKRLADVIIETEGTPGLKLVTPKR